MIRRREFITLLGGAAAWPVGTRAQQGERVRRIGVLIGIGDDRVGQRYVATFLQGLRELGWTDGQNIRLEFRWTGGDPDRTSAFARELAEQQPDVLVGHTAPVAAALLQQTQKIPIIFVNVTDPIKVGLVASFSRPGGNATGFTGFEFSLGSKWVELFKDIAPHVRRVALIFNPTVATPFDQFLRPA